jgi:protein-disulfide isomerase
LAVSSEERALKWEWRALARLLHAEPASRRGAPVSKGLTIFLAAASLGGTLQAEDRPEPPPSLSIQQQLDELKAGQERLLKELEEIRALLQERQEKLAVASALPPPAKVITLNLQGEPYRGQSTATVAVVEYSDFGCPFCAKYVRETYPLIDKEYVQPGKVRYFFRDLPAPEHTNALAAACAARCAGEQGKFWEMHDLLFAAQPGFAPGDLASYAEGLGLDAKQFSQCLASSKYEQIIRKVIGSAERMGLYGTPVFLIGTIAGEGTIFRATKVLVGGSELDALRSALDEALAAPRK